MVSSQVYERPLRFGEKGGKYGKFFVAGLNSIGIKTSKSGLKDRITHSGVVVTLANGKRYLVHLAEDSDGAKPKHLVVDGKHMSDDWKPVGSAKNVGGKATVAEFRNAMKDGWTAWKNCHDSSDEMMKKGRKKRSASCPVG